MRKLLSMGLLGVALVGVLALCWSPAQAQKPGGGGSGCSSCAGQVCCYGCNGQFAYCARSHVYCPECPAP